MTVADSPSKIESWLTAIESMTGAVSSTVIANEASERFPKRSVAVKVTMVVPNGKNPGAASAVTTGFGSTRSIAVAEPKLTSAPPATICVIANAGNTISGGVVSTTVTVNSADAV